MNLTQKLMINIKALEDITDVQCSEGNWNYDPYMQGLANGMILSLAIIQDKAPKFKGAPIKWMKDIESDCTQLDGEVYIECGD